MNLRIYAFLALTASAMNAYSEPVDSFRIGTGSQGELTEFLEQVRLEHGDSAARSIIKDIALVVGNQLSNSQMDEAYAEGDTETVFHMMNTLRNEALLKIDGMTVSALREKAEPLEHEYRLDRKKKAQARLPSFEEAKAQAIRVQAFRDQLDLLKPEFVRNKDEFGYLAPEFAVTLNNKSDMTIRAMDIDVHAWRTIDPDVKGSTQIRLKFAGSPVEPGHSYRVTEAISPLSPLSEAVAKGAGQGSRLQVLVVYSVENGRTELVGTWTEQMEANLQKLREYASYQSE